MRAVRVSLLAILVGLGVLTLGVLTPGSLGDGAPGWLPAPITLSTGRVTYHIARDGQISQITNASLFPGDASWQISGVWYSVRHHHLVVGRGHETIWRSHGEIAENQIGVIVAGSRRVAFQHAHELFLAPLGGAERAVASREAPLGWTVGGLYTYRYRTRQVLLRSDAGRLLKVITWHPFNAVRAVVNGTLYYLAHGVLMTARGSHVRRLDSLARLGLSTDTWLNPLDRLIELEDNSRLVVLRPDGSEFGWTPGVNPSSSPVLAPDGSAVAFTAAQGRSPTETVYLLRFGAHRAIALRREPIETGCAESASVQWHGRWLLYTATGGYVTAIETAGVQQRVVDLTDLGRRLFGGRQDVSAYWSDEPPAP